MHFRGPIAQPGSELPAHNRLVPGSNPGGPIPFVPVFGFSFSAAAAGGLYHDDEKKHCATRTTLAEGRIA